ncbi:MAG: 50S ribosomal protein L22 [Verrucomicrobia bacterium GWC2_42_7]|nr:MAG: 50S ribosomal protein L22 [Verrucomicrobia bacterium GWC2_42_7]
MEVISLMKYARMSPIKVRQVARQVQGLPAEKALDLLKFIPRKSARLIAKTLKSAVANAENNFNLPTDELVVKRAIVEDGVVFKRFQPAARGSAHPIRKHTCHIRIVLSNN